MLSKRIAIVTGNGVEAVVPILFPKSPEHTITETNPPLDNKIVGTNQDVSHISSKLYDPCMQISSSPLTQRYMSLLEVRLRKY